MPLIIRLPGGATNGAVIDTPVTLMDLSPTLLNVAGVAVEPDLLEELDGKSLVPLLEDEPLEWVEHEAPYCHFPHDYPTTTPVDAIRSGNWKLLEYFEDGRLELDNLASDPGELENLTSAQPERTSELHQQLSDWRARVDAQMPEPNPACPANH